MRSFIWISLIASSVLYSQERVELLSYSADANGSKIFLHNNPVLLYQDSLLSASEISYDRDTSIIEAKGSINVFKARHYHVKSDQATFALNSEEQKLKPYFMIDHDSKMWMSSKEATGCKNEIDLDSGIVSGCDSTDPLWKIRFSSADYDSEDMWVNLYNARLEFGNYSLFYLPYIGYSTNNDRRSGLLIPSFGLSNSEGFYYEQPIYIAPRNWWDLELRPQIRTQRGVGLYADFRFVDTASSEGSIGIGYFKENESYFKEYDLANQNHYGYRVHYRHSAPIQEWFNIGMEGESGLYIDGVWMNDVDFLNLQHSDETQNITDNQILSRMNAYYSSEDNYVGMYLKHYQYLDKSVAYDQTIQTLPTLHYHRFLETMFQDRVLWNADIAVNNFYRPEGVRAIQGEIGIPITYRESFFDDLIDVSYTLNGSYKLIGFSGEPLSGDSGDYTNGIYGKLDHTLAVSSMLVKNYGESVHVLTPFISYTFAGNRYYTGYYNTYRKNNLCASSTNSECDFYSLSTPNDELSLGLSNYIFNNGRQTFLDRLSQGVRYDDQKSYYGDLENELEWQINRDISYYNQTSYNHERNRITKEQNSIRYSSDTITAGLSHYYSDELRNNIPQYASYWTADASYQYNSNYRFMGLMAYDYQEQLFKRSELGFMYSQRCWDFGIRFVQNRRPILTYPNSSNVANDSYVFLTLILKPIGGSEFKYRFAD